MYPIQRNPIYVNILLVLLFLPKNFICTDFPKDLCLDESLSTNYFQSSLSILFSAQNLELKKPLASGANGVVQVLSYKKRETRILSNVEAAVKKLTLKLDENFASKSQLLISEIEVLKKSKQIYKGKMLDYHNCFIKRNPENVELFIVMESMYQPLENTGVARTQSEAIKSFLKKSTTERLRAYVSMADQLRMLHDIDYVHSDIKTANMMFTNKNLNQIKLIDFGSTVKKGETIWEITTFYAENSVAEIFESKKWKPSPAANELMDIYSMGMTIAEAELGKVIIIKRRKDFNQATESGKRLARVSNILEHISKVGKWKKEPREFSFEMFLRKLLANDRINRLQSATLALDWLKLLIQIEEGKSTDTNFFKRVKNRLRVQLI